MDETARLADLVASRTVDDAPDAALDRARLAVRDFVGLALHGAEQQVGRALTDHLSRLGSTDDATVVGGGRADPPRAAFANGAFGHAANFDDTFESVVVHPTCTALPAALATVEATGGTGRDLLAGYLVGLDVAHRVGRSVAPNHWLEGWHATATVGTFAAAAAAARVLDHPAERVRHALGIAASLASGLKRNIPTTTNAVHCGHAAGKGVEAALLADAGVTADEAILGGAFGFGDLATGGAGYDPSAILDPGVEWAVLDLAFKPYPSGVVTHAAMEALRLVLEREALGPDDVAGVIATVDERVLDTIDQHDPQTAAEANVSYEFCLAAVLRERDPGLDAFTDAYVREPATRREMAKVRLDPGPEPVGRAVAEASYGARVAVETTDGRVLTEAVPTAPGAPSNPLPEARLREKFHACAGTSLDHTAAERVEDAVGRLGEDGALADLLEAVTP